MMGIAAGTKTGKFVEFDDYVFAPLEEATEKELAENLRSFAEAARALIEMGAKPDGVLNWLKNFKQFSLDGVEFDADTEGLTDYEDITPEVYAEYKAENAWDESKHPRDKDGKFGSGEGEDGEIEHDNNIVDLSEHFSKTPTVQELREYINDIVENGTKFATLSPDWLVDIKGGRKKKDHLIYSSKYRTSSLAEKRRHRQYIQALEELLSKAEYSGSKQNIKTEKKPDVEKYHYFTSKVKSGSKMYRLGFVAEQYKGESENKPQTVHLYDVLEI